MYCMLEMTSGKLKTPRWIDEKSYAKAVETLKQSETLHEVMKLFSFCNEALDELKYWSEHEETYPQYLMRNKHIAERYCRGVLLEIKTYFLRVESKLEQVYGAESAILKLFSDNKDNMKQTCREFAFVLDLKECTNHCNEIVHSFDSPNRKDCISPCCIPDSLLSNFKGWSKVSKSYLRQVGTRIDIIEVFDIVYKKMEFIQNELINSLLNDNGLDLKLLELESWTNQYFTKDNCSYFHLAQMVYKKTGRPAPKTAFYQNKLPVDFNVQAVDWNWFLEVIDYLKK